MHTDVVVLLADEPDEVRREKPVPRCSKTIGRPPSRRISISSARRRLRRSPRSRARAIDVRAELGVAVVGLVSSVSVAGAEPGPTPATVAHQLPRRVHQRLLVVRLELVLEAVAFRVVQRRNQERVVDLFGRLRLDEAIDQLGGLGDVTRKKALVVAVLRRECGRIRQHGRDERQAWDVLPENHEADGKRRGHERPSGPHSQVQKATATRRATCDTPAASAYRTVSSTRFVNSSSRT